MLRTAEWLLVPNFHIALQPCLLQGGVETSQLHHWSARHSSSDGFQQVSAAPRSTPALQGSARSSVGRGMVKDPITLVSQGRQGRNRLLLSLPQPATSLPAMGKQAGGPGSGEHPLVLSHTTTDWLRWDGTSGDGPVQPPIQTRMLRAVSGWVFEPLQGWRLHSVPG